MRSTKYGGIEHYILEAARQCNKLGYHTVVQYHELPRSNAYRNDLKDIGVEVIPLQLKLNPLNIARLIFRVRPEVIHTYFPNKVILFQSIIIAKALGVRKSIAMVLSMPHTREISLIRKYAYNSYDQVICISNAISEKLNHDGIDKNILS